MRAFVQLVLWDWVREMRRKETLIAMGLVSLITLFLFSFAVPTDASTLKETAGGMLWVTFLLAGTVGIDRAFRGDGDGRLLEALLVAPVERGTIYLAKVAATFLFIAVMEAVSLILFVVLFNQGASLGGWMWIAGAAVLATFGFVVVGVLLSAMTWSLRGGDVLLRILLFPLVIPVFYAAVQITNLALQGKPPGAERFGVLFAFDVVYLGIGMLAFEHAVKD